MNGLLIFLILAQFLLSAANIVFRAIIGTMIGSNSHNYDMTMDSDDQVTQGARLSAANVSTCYSGILRIQSQKGSPIPSL